MKIQRKFKLLTPLLVGCAVAALAGTSFAADKLRVGGAVYGLKAEFANLWAAALKKNAQKPASAPWASENLSEREKNRRTDHERIPANEANRRGTRETG